MLQPPNGRGSQQLMQLIPIVAEQALRQSLLELERCGFQPLGIATQGSGVTGRALSADGTTWAELNAPSSDLRGSWRELLKTGVLRGAGCTAQFTTGLNNGDKLVTRGAESAPGMPLRDLALLHMQRLDACLLRRHPLKPLIRTCNEDSAAAAQPRGPSQPLSVNALLQLGVAPRLARLIAGDCAEALVR
jgi:hypothetical protein